MTTVDDIAAAVVSRLEGNAEVAAALPGGCWYGRADEQAPAGAYAVFALETAGEAEWYSDGTFTCPYTLRVAAYSAQGTGDATAIQRALAGALSVGPTGWGDLEQGRVLHCLARGYDGKFSPTLRSAADVFVSGAQWALLIEGDTEP